MMDATRAVEIAIIDEIQMLEDLERGSAWTAAVCGVPAKTVYLLGSLVARPAIEALAQRLGSPLEVGHPATRRRWRWKLSASAALANCNAVTHWIAFAPRGAGVGGRRHQGRVQGRHDLRQPLARKCAAPRPSASAMARPMWWSPPTPSAWA